MSEGQPCSFSETPACHVCVVSLKAPIKLTTRICSVFQDYEHKCMTAKKLETPPHLSAYLNVYASRSELSNMSQTPC